MSPSSDATPRWRRCTPADAEVLGVLNAQLSEDEGAAVATPSAYLERARDWLTTGRYEAAIAEAGTEPVGYVVWRRDPDYGDVYVRQFFVARDHRSRGLGRALFEEAAQEFWDGEVLRLDVYDSNPRGGAFWESLGFVAYSRLMRRSPSPSAG